MTTRMPAVTATKPVQPKNEPEGTSIPLDPILDKIQGKTAEGRACRYCGEIDDGHNACSASGGNCHEFVDLEEYPLSSAYLVHRIRNQRDGLAAVLKMTKDALDRARDYNFKGAREASENAALALASVEQGE